MLLAHSLIIHHHHDFTAVSVSSYNAHENEHLNHNGDSHQHDTPVNDEHDNSLSGQHEHDSTNHFHHLSATSDSYFTQLNLSKRIQPSITIVLFVIDCKELYKPLIRKYVNCNLPFRITSLFKPGAIALRGPPSIV